MFATVAIATDGSASVTRAAAMGIDLARRFDAQLVGISVIDTREVETAPAHLQAELEAALTERATAALDTLAAMADAPIERVVERGRPAAAVIAAAERVGADLLVVGTRGRHGENRLLLGSVAERLVRTAPMPVCTVRQLEAAHG